MTKSKTVFVGLSGGVDSSVAALRLKKQGYTVVGVFIKVWHPDFMICNWQAERLDAMRVAAHLEIPFLTCDAEGAYKKAVADYFIAEYLAGRTPNPDVLCNKEVKFGAFLEFALARKADFVATGHYVQNINNELHRGADPAKDQSYFLWSLTNEQLSHCLFPIGNSKKEVIRKEASAHNIPTATKKDSQGVCFLGHIDIPEFLSHYTSLIPGVVLNEEGKVIGSHRSALIYTLGQRHGFTIDMKDANRTQHYVMKRDIEANTITVSTQPPILQPYSHITLINNTLREAVSKGEAFDTQFRYRQKPFSSIIADITENEIILAISDNVETPAAGQSCVLYKGSRCIGGGSIK